MSDAGHVWDISAHVNQPHPFLFLFETLRDTTDMGGPPIFYLFLVSIFNTFFFFLISNKISLKIKRETPKYTGCIQGGTIKSEQYKNQENPK